MLWNWYQIIVWIIYWCKILIINIFILPSFSSIVWQIWCFFVVDSLFIITVVFWAISTLIDISYKAWLGSNLTGVDQHDDIESTDGYPFCSDWNIKVSPDCKHWSDWNKWIKNFDHHWVWLNNCIWARNYKYFACLLIFSFLFGISYLFWSLSFIVCYHANEGFISKSSLRISYDADNSNSFWVLAYWFNWVGIWLCLLTEILVTGLIIFHLYLKWNNISTYDFIRKRRNSKNKVNLILKKILLYFRFILMKIKKNKNHEK